MDRTTDQQLLRDYAGERSESAFAELTRRHVDFVYSAALRLVRDAHGAEDVTQGVFTALAQNAGQLGSHPVLSGWLHRTTRNIAAQTIRTDTRRRAREQEAFAMNNQPASESDSVWDQIAPHLDAALGELNEPDRDALLLRFFERKSAREMGEVLKISDEAAQKRVARAMDRLREFLAKRGVTVGAGGLVVAVSANAVQAAPAGLALTVSALAGTTVATALTTHLTINWITMKMFGAMAAAAIIAGTGTFLVQQGRIDRLREQRLMFQRDPRAAAVSLRQVMGRNVTSSFNMTLPTESEQQKKDQAELRRLRGEVGQLRQQLELAQAQARPQAKTGPVAPTAAAHPPGSYIPADQLAHAGFATPEAAMESITWAMLHGTFDQVTEVISPDIRAAELKELGGS